MAKSEIPINPRVLSWARERAGYSLSEISKKPSFSKFPQWERGQSAPSYSQLEKIADILHRPIALFFFPSPPEEETIERSLRAVSEEDVTSLSPTIRHLFRKAKAFQISLKELQAENDKLQSQQLTWARNASINNVSQVSKNVRAALGITIEEQKSWANSEIAFKNWRSAFAESGIYVFKEAFKNDRIAGFCIYDELYPIIFINNSMGFNRQIFTLFHELAHILFKQSYLDVFDHNFWQLEFNDPSHIEVICNSFAGEFLVPEEEFIAEVRHLSLAEIDFRSLADKYNVSREVILRRFLTYDLIDRGTYTHIVEDWYQAYLATKRKEKEKLKEKKPTGNYHNTKMAYLGDAFLGIVLRSYNQGKIDINEASMHLDVKRKALPIIQEKFLNREGSSVRF